MEYMSHVMLTSRQKLEERDQRLARARLKNDKELERNIEKRLHPLVSPEIIAHDENICHETIYAWVYRSRSNLKIQLPQRGKKRRRYGSKRGIKQGC